VNVVESNSSSYHGRVSVSLAPTGACRRNGTTSPVPSGKLGFTDRLRSCSRSKATRRRPTRICPRPVAKSSRSPRSDEDNRYRPRCRLLANLRSCAEHEGAVDDCHCPHVVADDRVSLSTIARLLSLKGAIDSYDKSPNISGAFDVAFWHIADIRGSATICPQSG
jgi:hypothetical protein